MCGEKISFRLYINQSFSNDEVNKLLEDINIWADNKGLQFQNLSIKKGSIEIEAVILIATVFAVSNVGLFVLKAVAGEWIKEKYKQVTHDRSENSNGNGNEIEMQVMLDRIKEEKVFFGNEIEKSLPLSNVIQDVLSMKGPDTTITIEIKHAGESSEVSIRTEISASHRGISINYSEKL